MGPGPGGAVHAHVGWLSKPQPTDEQHWATDLVRDPDMVLISRLFPVLGVGSVVAPGVIGWLVTGTAAGALGGFVWGDLVRVFVLHHATFSQLGLPSLGPSSLRHPR